MKFSRDTNRLPAPAPAPAAADSKQYRAVVGITSEDARYEVGQEVPAAVVEAAPWLLERGAVALEAPATPGTEDTPQ